MSSAMKSLLALTMLAAASASPVLAQSPAAGTAAPVAIFVTSAGAASGGMDPNKDTQASVDDLRKVLREPAPERRAATAQGQRSPGAVVTLVDQRKDARVVLLVTSRSLAPIEDTGFGQAQRQVMLNATLIAGTSEVRMSASALGATTATSAVWALAAERLAEKVEQWVVANRERLPATTPAP